MRGITLWQPWASAVALAVKKIETRTWLTQYRGPLAIHAARDAAPQQARFYALHEKTLRRAGLDVERPLPLGEIIAVVELGAIVGSDLCRPSTMEFPWGDYSPGRWCWLLKAPAILETPIPFRGSQTFFTVPDELIDSHR